MCACNISKIENEKNKRNFFELCCVCVVLCGVFLIYSPFPVTPKIGLICSNITSWRQVVGANRAQIGINPGVARKKWERKLEKKKKKHTPFLPHSNSISHPHTDSLSCSLSLWQTNIFSLPLTLSYTHSHSHQLSSPSHSPA